MKPLGETSWIEDTHNSWLYCFAYPLELGTGVSHTADDTKAKHMSQVQENKWNNITKSCVYLQLLTFFGNFITFVGHWPTRTSFIFVIEIFSTKASELFTCCWFWNYTFIINRTNFVINLRSSMRWCLCRNDNVKYSKFSLCSASFLNLNNFWSIPITQQSLGVTSYRVKLASSVDNTDHWDSIACNSISRKTLWKF